MTRYKISYSTSLKGLRTLGASYFCAYIRLNNYGKIRVELIDSALCLNTVVRLNETISVSDLVDKFMEFATRWKR